MKNLSLKISLFLVMASFSEVMAQYAEQIRSGRPGVSIGPFTVGKGVVQNQSGIYFTERHITQAAMRSIDKGAYGISIFRIGILERFEFGTAVSYKDNRITFSDHDNSIRTEGINLLSLAGRVNLYEGKGLWPALGFQLNTDLTNISKEFRNSVTTPRFSFITAQSIGKWRIITNWMIRWPGGSSPTYLISFFTDYGITKEWRIFAEHYATASAGNYQPNFDYGITYLVNRDIQLDLQYSHGPWYNNQWNQFITAGIGWRFRLKSREEN